MINNGTSNSTPSSQTTTMQPVHPVQRSRHLDEFDAPEFENSRERLPYLQMLNHQQPEQSGFFLSLESAEAVGFRDLSHEWQGHQATFQSGNIVTGYRHLVARFLILHKSPLLMFDRESGDFLAPFAKHRYDRNTVVLKTRYLVYLLGRKKQLLHDRPLLFTAKGAFCGSFGEAYNHFRQEMSQAYSQTTGSRKARGDRFLALSVFAVQVQPELKGNKSKSWVCSVKQYGQPTAETWQSYFVGYQTEVKTKILEEFEEWADFGNPERETPSSAAALQEDQSQHWRDTEAFHDFEYELSDSDTF